MRHADTDNVMDYFTTIRENDSPNLAEIHTQIFESCAQNFLNGIQKLNFNNGVKSIQERLLSWDTKNFERLNRPNLDEYDLQDLNEARTSIILFTNWDQSMKEAINHLNDQPRSRWLIQAKKYAQEISGHNDDAEDATD